MTFGSDFSGAMRKSREREEIRRNTQANTLTLTEDGVRVASTARSYGNTNPKEG